MEKMIRIVNFKQACAYIRAGVQPIKLEYNEKGRMVFIFREEDTTEIWNLWKRHEVEI